MTLQDVATYGKVRARADHPATPPEEAHTARNVCARMEADHPGIREAWARAERAVKNERAPGPGQPPRPGERKSPLWGVVENMLAGAASKIATDLEQEVQERAAPLDKGDVSLKPRDCAPGQVCLEVRARVDDLRRASTREEFLDAIDRELRALARRVP